MKKLFLLIASALTLASVSVFAERLPSYPTDPLHPGSNQYPYQVTKESFQFDGRKVDVFLPTELKGLKQASVVIYGHGQATPLESYSATFEHLARKGVVVAFPQFDNGFFDQDWRRMASDFNRLTAETLKRYADSLDATRMVYAGHSKGAYIALMAAGAPSVAGLNPRALVLFAPAGYDAEYLQRLDPSIPMTLVWGEADTIIKRPSLQDIYNRAPSRMKQFIDVKSYTGTEPALQADHFFVVNKSSFMGGRDGISPFHYHGAWKWLLGATLDLEAGGSVTNPYLYGDEASTSGLPRVNHVITRSWR